MFVKGHHPHTPSFEIISPITKIHPISENPSFPHLTHSMHWDISPPQKYPPIFFAKPPLKTANFPYPSLGNPPIYIGFHKPP